MKFAQHSLTYKLATINVMLFLALLAVVVPAWIVLPSDREASEAIAEMGRAQRAVQTADMLHDTLNSDVLSALLVGQLPKTEGPGVLAQLREDANSFRQELAQLERAPLPAALKAPIAAASKAGRDYVDRAEQVAALALKDRPAALAAMAEFQRVFEDAKVALAEQTETLAKVRETAHREAQEEAQRAKRLLLVAALAAVGLGMLCVALIGRSIRRPLAGLRDVASAIAEGDFSRRTEHRANDEVGRLAQSINLMAGKLNEMIGRLREEAERGAFRSQLAHALEMADNESDACEAASRAMVQISATHAVELLLADSSHARLQASAVHPVRGGPDCGVDSPNSCAAVRHGHPMHFADAHALDACPKLRQREQAPGGAVCVPVTFMGRSLGVLHAAAAPGACISEAETDRLTTLGSQVGTRLGTVRAFESSQLQASTDALTGLANRRMVERRLRDLSLSHKPFALVMCDLDHFKRLNDTHGHPAGDEALRVFADAVRGSAREGDITGRWGGEEFAFVLAGADAAEALEWTTRLRTRLATTLARGQSAPFTASFGIADSRTANTPERLVRWADEALYRAKAAGRDRAVLADAQGTPQGPAAPKPASREPARPLESVSST